MRGEIAATAGARRVHGLVLGNAFASLKQQLRGAPCGVFADSLDREELFEGVAAEPAS